MNNSKNDRTPIYLAEYNICKAYDEDKITKTTRDKFLNFLDSNKTNYTIKRARTPEQFETSNAPAMNVEYFLDDTFHTILTNAICKFRAQYGYKAYALNEYLRAVTNIDERLDNPSIKPSYLADYTTSGDTSFVEHCENYYSEHLEEFAKLSIDVRDYLKSQSIRVYSKLVSMKDEAGIRFENPTTNDALREEQIANIAEMQEIYNISETNTTPTTPSRSKAFREYMANRKKGLDSKSPKPTPHPSEYMNKE